MKAEAKLHFHRQAMFFQKLGEARRVAADFEKTMHQVGATVGATAEDLQRLSDQVIAQSQQDSFSTPTEHGTAAPPHLAC